jgi:hypothetical protein
MTLQFIAPTKRRSMTKARAALNAERASELLSYSPETGILTWKIARSGVAKLGQRAGSAAHWNGYRVLRIGGHQYQEHAVAWLIFFGEWPASFLDHINGNRSDNRICNLRECSAAENAQNRGPDRDNKSGYLGVHKAPSGKWRAQIKKDGYRHYLGQFDTPELASAAYQKAKRQLHQFNPIPRQVRLG